MGNKLLGSYWIAKELLKNINKVIPLDDESSPVGVCKVLAGKADAMFFNAGKPIPHFKLLSMLGKKYDSLLGNFHFIPIKQKDYQGIESLKLLRYTTITPKDYEWLDKEIETVSTLAVLISFDFSLSDHRYHKRRCEELANLGVILERKLADLKNPSNGYHEKWSEVNFDFRGKIDPVWQAQLDPFKYDACFFKRTKTKP